VYLPSGIIVVEYLRILLQVVPIQLVDAVTACLFFGYLDAATNIAEKNANFRAKSKKTIHI
jgi:hypothetical protein